MEEMNDESQTKTKKENSLEWMLSYFILLNGIFICVNNVKHKEIWMLYAGSVLPIIAGGITIVYGIVLFKKIKMLQQKARYLAVGVFLLFMAVVHLLTGSRYMSDLIHGKEQVATDFYNIRKSFIVLYTEEEDIKVTLSEKQYEYMKENESEIDEEKILKCSDGFSVKGRERGVIVEYYPNTKSAVEIKME